jgi:hypothetical protein
MKTHKIMFTVLAVGFFAFLSQMQAVTPAPDGCYSNFTTAEGCNALKNLTSGAGNTGLGWFALFGTSTGSFNTGVGGGALALNNGNSNTATGAAALLLNTSGIENTAVGTDAMVFNDTGNDNTAVGAFALMNNIDGFQNNAFGNHALFSHTGSMAGNPKGFPGGFNNAFGALALTTDQTGTSNNAFGDAALQNNVSGNNNTAVGDLALQASTGNFNIGIGAQAGTATGFVSNNIYIGDPGFAGDQNVISIGAIAASGTPYEMTFIGGIYGASVNTISALPVYVDTDGHLGTTLVNASGQKVRTRSSHSAQPQAMSNEFKKQQKRIAHLEDTVASLAAIVKEQAAQIQKVNAQLELKNPSPRVVVSP